MADTCTNFGRQQQLDGLGDAGMDGMRTHTHTHTRRTHTRQGRNNNVSRIEWRQYRNLDRPVNKYALQTQTCSNAYSIGCHYLYAFPAPMCCHLAQAVQRRPPQRLRLRVCPQATYALDTIEKHRSGSTVHVPTGQGVCKSSWLILALMVNCHLCWSIKNPSATAGSLLRYVMSELNSSPISTTSISVTTTRSLSAQQSK